MSERREQLLDQLVNAKDTSEIRLIEEKLTVLDESELDELDE